MGILIKESFTLPSKGLVYENSINPDVTLRSMNTTDEVNRCAPTTLPYKGMCDMINDCILGDERTKINAYDLCLADYQFLLFKLRIVTHGSEYIMNINCPKDKRVTKAVTDLDEMDIYEYDETYETFKNITLPISKSEVTLKPQTPRALDTILRKNKEMQKRTKVSKDYTIIFTVASFIDTVDGRKLSDFELENYVKEMPMGDVNYIIAKGERLNNCLGYGANCVCTCEECGTEVVVPFCIGPEFFRPTVR